MAILSLKITVDPEYITNEDREMFRSTLGIEGSNNVTVTWNTDSC